MSSTKVCFNSNCKDTLDRSRKGWRRRTGEFADLCDRCASAYEEGKFCETFHLNASGWRCCESCGKQIHCGCIVSFHMFVLLDAGGIECITCARKSFILTPNPAWPPPSLFLPVLPERNKDFSSKNWTQIAGSGPMPWRQAPSLFSSSSAQLELQPRIPFEVDTRSGSDRLFSIERPSTASLERKTADKLSERLMNGSLKLGASDVLENGNAGINWAEQANVRVNVPLKSSFSKNDTSTSHFSLSVSSLSPNDANDQTKVPGTAAPRPTPTPVIGKIGAGLSGETQIRNGRPRGEARPRTQLLPRYWPRITDQELQKISGDSNSVFTPLFEKMLSASDAGRIGRLVLPKKCAETYFPPISSPEGLPLKVQDSKGKEWIFQFRFWPNNNSRMYVLEGVTPCIQSMQLQAGDIVTFSRIDPEGKLVMGFRKASTAPTSDQGNEAVNARSGDASAKKTKAGEVFSTPHQLKGRLVSPGISPINQANSADQTSPWPKDDVSRCLTKEVVGAKRKNSTLGSKSKRPRVETEELIELKLTWELAQGLFRPPPNNVSSVVVIEGFEFEEYEDAPIIGRPTIFATDNSGEKIQWAQCENCFKWRKLPADAFLPSRWTCSENSWDPERSLCSAAQELTAEELVCLLPTSTQGMETSPFKKIKAAKRDPDSDEALQALDALANLAIQEEGENLPESSQATTTKHPRHRPGCTCIVCIQPPSGKGPKHEQTCTCNICSMVRRRFQTLMSRREKKQSEKEAEKTALQYPEQNPEFPLMFPDDEEFQLCTVSPVEKTVNLASPLKGNIIDLNIQPERDDEVSSGSDSGGMMRLVQDATERYLRQQRLSSSRNGNLGGEQTLLSGVLPLGTNASASTSVTER
ncbi:B3 domain-containing protein Os07g0563300-like isoform X1 [Rhododendron vialii]|uniref:B3 domain-containing protein Os07g0563300-like isoform X1 n=1 Tax=Rhododendron vialii TaxID=182163 RepID=UPI00265F3AF4|nr:B3 domain-containing protein Os07g0563300-like isoform X1 [Rhododendron vialii]